MSVGITTAAVEHDPVRAALADPAVGVRLVAAARAFLGAGGYAQDAADVAQRAAATILRELAAAGEVRP